MIAEEQRPSKETNMPWCPDCHIEYHPGIAVCPDCGAEIVADPPYIPLDPPALSYLYCSHLRRREGGRGGFEIRWVHRFSTADQRCVARRHHSAPRHPR